MSKEEEEEELKLCRFMASVIVLPRIRGASVFELLPYEERYLILMDIQDGGEHFQDFTLISPHVLP